MNDHKESREITDPAELVKGRRYEAVDQDHPEYARSVGVFDGIRPDQEVGEDYVYFVNGQIGDVPQRIFGHPATQARCYREVGINALPASRRDAILKSPGLATIDAEGWGDIRGELDRGNWNGAAEIASQHANIQEAAMNQRAADEVWTLADLLVQEAKAEALLAAAPREGALIVVNARVQEVTRVNEDGGFYSSQEHSDGSGPTTHYWQAGTGWR